MASTRVSLEIRERLRALALRFLPRGTPLLAAVGHLVRGTAFAQLLTLAASPFLTRIYPPEAFGVLAAFVALVAIASTVATAEYPRAVLLPDDQEQALSVVRLCILLAGIAVVPTSVLAVFVAVSGPNSEAGLGLAAILLPVAVFITAANTTLIAYANRQQRYQLMARLTVRRALAQTALQVVGGLVNPTSAMLVASSTAGTATANAGLVKVWLADDRSAHLPPGKVGLRSLRATAWRYRKFPLYTLPASLVALAAMSGLPLVIAALYGTAVLGFWAVAWRVLSVPLSLVGTAIGQVYFRRAVELRSSPRHLVRLTRRLMLYLFMGSLVPFSLAWATAPWLFAAVFGPVWAEAGEYARIMIPWMWLRFIGSPLGPVTWVVERNRLGLLLQFTFACIVVACSVSAWTQGWEFTRYLTVLSVGCAVYYGAALVVYDRVLAGRARN